MRIGVIGSGQVGGTLGASWAKNGHAVVFGSRDPRSPEMKRLIEGAGSNARAATVREAVNSSDILLLATPWPAVRDALAAAGELVAGLFRRRYFGNAASCGLAPDGSGLRAVFMTIERYT